MHANLTKRLLEGHRGSPPTNRLYITDKKQPGLVAVVYPSGKITFQLYRRVDGRPTRHRIGRFSDLTVGEARKEAARLGGKIAKGEALKDNSAFPKTMTLRDGFELYLERHAKKHKATASEDEGLFRRYLQPWASRRLASLRQADIEALHTGLGLDPGETTANRVLALLSTMFNRLAGWGWTGDNPVKGIKRFREHSRERFLSADEMERFWAALNGEPDDLLRDCIALLLLTGQRKGNVRAMRWQDVDLKQREWRIPSSETKNRQSQVVPLVTAAMAILKRRRQVTLGTWVLPSHRSGSGHLEELRPAWLRLCERAEFEDLRLHDLRRTTGSWMTADGTSLTIVGKALGHRSSQATQVYARLEVEPVRVAMERATNAMIATRRRNHGA